jgi:hypothetical protein
MRHYDVFNGDADGICALHQLRLAEPHASQLVTGLKRDIALLGTIDAGPGDRVTVLDVSLERNRAPLEAMLARGAHVMYFDHHYAGEVPVHPNLRAFIDPSPGTCTSALVDLHLGGRHRIWAVVGAYGDNLEALALRLAAPLGLGEEQLGALQELGAALNYNAYGESDEDVLLPPSELYRIVQRYGDPFQLLRHEQSIARLSEERHADLARARATPPLRALPFADVWLLPDEPWSRRVSGTFANRLAAEEPQRAHAVLTPRPDGFTVSVRSPVGRLPTAVDFCRRYPTGGGRSAAAGIDRLERERLEPFLEAFSEAYRPAGA